jgi:hypothetical protein
MCTTAPTVNHYNSTHTHTCPHLLSGCCELPLRAAEVLCGRRELLARVCVRLRRLHELLLQLLARLLQLRQFAPGSLQLLLGGLRLCPRRVTLRSCCGQLGVGAVPLLRQQQHWRECEG